MRSVWNSLAQDSQVDILTDRWECEMLPQTPFLRTLARERKRTERSQRSFVLMLLKSVRFFRGTHSKQVYDRLLSALSSGTRETDVLGWYEAGSVIGVIFTEVGLQPRDVVVETLSKKFEAVLRDAMGDQHFAESTLTFHVYPEDPQPSDPQSCVNSALYPDLAFSASHNKVSLRVKRAIDIAGSLFAIILCAPLLVTVALLVKLTSRGPILFRQQRIGRYGKPFTFLKFRSMYQNNDHSIHREYVTKLIAERGTNGESGSKTKTVYKLTSDPRVTSIGKFLRRTSLDELPQLFNVLKGEMSLVGPRPPIPYELDAYATWHKSRLIVVKPGITGLWQVAGRSRVTFDEMVRLDLRYAASWSLWLDLVILLQTPRAVFTGQGAY